MLFTDPLRDVDLSVCLRDVRTAVPPRYSSILIAVDSGSSSEMCGSDYQKHSTFPRARMLHTK